MKVTIDLTPEAARTMLDSYELKETTIRAELTATRSTIQELRRIAAGRTSNGCAVRSPTGKRAKKGETERLVKEFFSDNERRVQFKSGLLSIRDVAKHIGCSASNASRHMRLQKLLD